MDASFWILFVSQGILNDDFKEIIGMGSFGLKILLSVSILTRSAHFAQFRLLGGHIDLRYSTTDMCGSKELLRSLHPRRIRPVEESPFGLSKNKVLLFMDQNLTWTDLSAIRDGCDDPSFQNTCYSLTLSNTFSSTWDFFFGGSASEYNDMLGATCNNPCSSGWRFWNLGEPVLLPKRSTTLLRCYCWQALPWMWFSIWRLVTPH